MTNKPRPLKKEKLLPGVMIEIRSDIPLTDGLGSSSALALGPGTGSPSRVIAAIEAQPPSYFAPKEPPTPGFDLVAGDVCTIVHGPKRLLGANVVRVKNAAGLEGHVFWCTLKANGMLHEPVSEHTNPKKGPSP